MPPTTRRCRSFAAGSGTPTRPPRRPRARPRWSPGCSRPRARARPIHDPADDVLPQVRTADLVQHVDQDLYGAYAVVDPDAAATNPGTTGLEPADLEQLPEAGRFTAVRNLLYALEWWVFGGFAAFVWWRYVRDATAAREPEPVPDDDPVPSEP